MKSIDRNRLVFIDEAGATVAMTRLRGRCPRGQRCRDAVPRNRGTVTTRIGSLRLDGMTSMMTIEGGTDTDVFPAYVDTVLGPTLRPGDIVGMDTLPAHRAKPVRDAIHRFGAYVKYTPPYSPEFTPIELAWSKLKEWLRAAKARCRARLDDAIAAAMKAITPADARGWFGECGYSDRCE